jgi:signal transduction histidine kinase
MKPKKLTLRRVFNIFFKYVVYFLSTAFTVSCCTILFIHSTSLKNTIDVAELREKAPITFGNVLLLSLIFVIIDSTARKFSVDRPAKRILEATEKVKKGDYSVKIEPIITIDDGNKFNLIIEDFNKMTEELSSVETLKTDFISNVSHELKTPLAVIQNYSTMLQAPNLTESQRLEYSKAITESSKRLSTLITNILKLNKLENQQIFPQFESYNLSEQLCECLLNFENVLEQKCLDIQVDLDEDVVVKSDKELLSLVWNNLFSNAIKFTEPQGRISVTLTQSDTHIVVSIADTGCGISPEMGKRIFEKFYQGDTSHATQGNGLGLALVKRVVDIVGGEITVDSTINKGSTFTVKLNR